MLGRKKPLVLTILDGWGFSPSTEGNAIAAARKPTYDTLLREYPNTVIHTSGPFVGLPEGQMGNSEVGHLNIGAGRVIQMDVTRIDMLIATGEFFKHPALLNLMKQARGHRLHFLGLCSDGGVHSYLTHLYALLKMAKQEGIADVFVHCFMDGRDTPPESGAAFVEQILQQMRTIGIGKIASVEGRYYAMDRDKRWERIERAFGAMVLGNGEKATDPVAAVKRSYEKGVTDEFIEPITIVDSTQRTGRSDSRRRRVYVFQLSRRSRPRNDHGAHGPGAGNPVPLHRAQESLVLDHDAVRQELHGSLRHRTAASE